MKRCLYVTFLSFVLCGSVLANKYDDDVKLRKYFEEEARKEQAERDAAEARYNKQHSSNDSGGGLGGAIITFSLLGVIVCAFVKSYKDSK